MVQLISSITRQLAEQCTPIPPEVKAFREKYVDKRIQPTTEDWIPLIECISSLFEQTYIFVDALVQYNNPPCPPSPFSFFLPLSPCHFYSSSLISMCHFRHFFPHRLYYEGLKC